MRELKAIVSSVTLFGLLSCHSGTEELSDSFRTAQLQESFEQKLQREISAPVIVAGQVMGYQFVTPATNSPGDPRIKTQAIRIAIHVEQVIKGSISSNPLYFYYFVFARENRVDLGRRRYFPAIGENRIFFLTARGSALRSIGDVTDYTLEIDSGQHDAGFCSGRSAGCCIAELLLSPGSNMTVDRFAHTLYEAAYAAGVVCSRRVAYDLVRRLEFSKDESISAASRETIKMLKL